MILRSAGDRHTWLRGKVPGGRRSVRNVSWARGEGGVTDVFDRGLSEGLFREFQGGPCATILRAGVDAGLDVRLRPNSVSLYYRGRSMARVLERKRGPTRLEIHTEYLATGRIGRFAGRQRGDYLVFDVGAAFAEDYAAQLGAMIRLAHEHVGREENVELRLVKENDATAHVCCFDRQIQVPGKRRQFDVVGVTATGEPVLVAIEVKRYPDGSIQRVPRQLHGYLEILDPGRKGLRSDIAQSYRRVCGQLRQADRLAHERTAGIVEHLMDVFVDGIDVPA